MDWSLPGFSVHGISQARILEWIANSSSRGSSPQGIEPVPPALAGEFFTAEPPGTRRHFSHQLTKDVVRFICYNISCSEFCQAWPEQASPWHGAKLGHCICLAEHWPWSLLILFCLYCVEKWYLFLSLSLFFFSCLSSDLTSSVSKVAQLVKKQPKMQEITCNEGDLGLKLLKAPRAGEIGKKRKSV